MGDEQAVLQANAAFYSAFAAGDADAMDGLWARRLPVVCTHPGWMPLVGRATVIESWRAILASPPQVAADRGRVFLYGEAAMVICREMVGSAILAATNLFVREDGAWRMVHHQACPTAESVEPPPRAHLH